MSETESLREKLELTLDGEVAEVMRVFSFFSFFFDALYKSRAERT